MADIASRTGIFILKLEEIMRTHLELILPYFKHAQLSNTALTILFSWLNLLVRDWNPFRSELSITIVWYFDGIDDVAATTL